MENGEPTARDTRKVVSRSSTAAVITVSAVSSLVMLDSNIVAVSLPAIGRSFAAGFEGLQWVIGAYVLAFCALLIPAGSYADLRGRKSAMGKGLAVFAAASLGCGLARSAFALDLCRAVQGAGAALLLTSAMAIISHDHVGSDRVRAFAIWGASIGVALAGGPIVGGIITQLFGWRPIFLLNLPLCLGLAVATARTVRESRDPAARGFDIPGVIAFSLGLIFLVDALIQGNDLGWTSTGLLARLVGAVFLLSAFGWLEARNPGAMLDVTLFRARSFNGAILTMVGYGAALQVLIFLLPLYLQAAFGFGPIRAGLGMLPFAAPMVVVPRFAGRLAALASTGGQLASGLAAGALGEAAISICAREGMPYAWVAAGMALAGCGAGLLNGLTVKAVQSSVPEDRAGIASGMAATARFIGVLVSVAGLGAILADGARDLFFPAAAEHGMSSAAAESAFRLLAVGDVAGAAARAPEGAVGAIREAGLAAYGAGFSDAIAAAALVAAATAFLAWRLLGKEETAAASPPCAPIDCRHPI